MAGIRQEGRRYLFGLYKGLVAVNTDPESRGRIKVKIPTIWNQQVHPTWAEPSFPSNEVFTVPTVGSQVWIAFEEGDPNSPIYIGSFLKSSEPHVSAKNASPLNRSIKTANNLEVSLDDSINEIHIQIKGTNTTANVLVPGPATLDAKGEAFMKLEEGGLKLNAYQLTVGVHPKTGATIKDVWTIGYGHTGPDVYEGQVIDETQADDLFAVDKTDFETSLSALVKVPLNQNQFNALMSLVYNIGIPNFAESNQLKLLNAGKYTQSAAEFASWRLARGVVSRGLVARRARELALWNSPSAASESSDPPIKIILRKDGNKIILDAEAIELGEGATEPIVLGDSFKSLFNSHVHNYIPGSPGPTTTTSPPTSSMGSGQLSDISKVK